MENPVLYVIWLVGLWIAWMLVEESEYPADKECLCCGSLNNVLTYSLYDENRKICAYCADEEAEKAGLRRY